MSMTEALTKLADHIYGLDSGSPEAKLIYGARDEITRLSADRNVVIEECAQAARQADRTGREWVADSLWDRIAERAAEAVRTLKS